MRTLCLLVVFSLALPCADAGVLTVGGPAPTHPNLQAAVTAAADGDVILVKQGVSESVVVNGKGVSIVADAATQLAWSGSLDIQNVPAGSTMLFAGFNFSSSSILAVRVRDCSGAVRLQDVRAVSTFAFSSSPWSVVECTNSTDVALTRCTVTGASFGPFGGQQYGAQVTDSTVAIHDSIFTGGNGGPGSISGPSPTDGGPGAAALVVNGSSVVFASGCTFQGGTGGNGANGTLSAPICFTPYNHPTSGGTGGPGVQIGTGASCSGAGNALLGGNGGANGVSPCAPTPSTAPSGPQYAGAGGPWVELGTVARKLEVKSLTRESTSLTITFRGAPFERVFLTSSMHPAHLSSPLLQGVFLSQGPHRRLSPGTLDAQGVLQISLPIGDLGPGISDDARHLQCVMLDAAGQPRLGSSAMLVRLDSAW